MCCFQLHNLCRYILDYLTSKDFSPKDLVVVSPDVGGVPRWGCTS
jgi:phosphoribosylpyrophosphate synthetase